MAKSNSTIYLLRIWPANGLCKEKKNIRDYYGSGWVGLGLSDFFYIVQIALNQCSVHVSDGFPKKTNLDGGWVGGVSSIQFFLEFV